MQVELGRFCTWQNLYSEGHFRYIKGPCFFHTPEESR